MSFLGYVQHMLLEPLQRLDQECCKKGITKFYQIILRIFHIITCFFYLYVTQTPVNIKLIQYKHREYHIRNNSSIYNLGMRQQ
jgi:hypothetical protein